MSEKGFILEVGLPFLWSATLLFFLCMQSPHLLQVSLCCQHNVQFHSTNSMNTTQPCHTHHSTACTFSSNKFYTSFYSPVHSSHFCFEAFLDHCWATETLPGLIFHIKVKVFQQLKAAFPGWLLTWNICRKCTAEWRTADWWIWHDYCCMDGHFTELFCCFFCFPSLFCLCWPLFEYKLLFEKWCFYILTVWYETIKMNMHTSQRR